MDELVGGIEQGASVRVLCAVTTALSDHARSIHQLAPASATLLSQALTAVTLQGGLLKAPSKVSLQLECDGPLRGLFADNDGEGGLRGYAKNREVAFQGLEASQRFRPVIGNSGYLSCLRQRPDGEFYRSSVALEAMDLSLDLERFFATSDQVPTRVWLEALVSESGAVTAAGGLLLQTLPGVDPSALEELAGRVASKGGLARALAATPAPSAAALAQSLLPGASLELLSKQPLDYRCRCSRQRVSDALSTLGAKGLEELISSQGKADVTCEFCTARYVFEADELRALAQAAGSGSPAS